MTYFKFIKISRFQSDLIWNYISLIILGLSGFGLNISIGLFYNPSVLGVFNQVLTFYVIFSMIGSVGINYSLLSEISSNIEDNNGLESIVGGGLTLVSLSSLFTTLLFLISINPISIFLDSRLISEGMIFISPGLYLFCINKVLLNGVINGLNKMKAYALFQSLRYLFLLFCIIIACLIHIKGSRLTIIFSLTEFVLFFFLIFFVSKKIKWWEGKFTYKWARKHLDFGFKSFMGSVLVEINSRVDILFLGLFLSDRSVGIYSFSALFAEGFYQILTILQNIYNPILSKNIRLGKKDYIKNLLQKHIRNCYKIVIPLGIFFIFLYPTLIKLLINNDIYLQSINPFRILILGMIIACGYMPFYNLFSMSNEPWLQSIFMISIVLTNIIANIILIPIFEINGAALGTTISFITSIFIFKALLKQKIRIEI